MRLDSVQAVLGPIAYSIPYSEYILAPSSRIVHPVSIYQINGTVTNVNTLIGASGGNATFNGVSAVTFDYGKNIAGLVSLTVGGVSSSTASIGLTFSESSQFVSHLASDGTGESVDEIYWLPVGGGPGTYTVDEDHNRGGFRYLSLISSSNASVSVLEVSTAFTAAPLQDLQAYTGYFHCNDELINRIWYAGAYTNQLCTIDPKYGDSIAVPRNPDKPFGPDVWYSNWTIAQGGSCLVDGAKRDRIVWPGDMVISLPSIFVSTNDLYSLKVSLDSLLFYQQPSGQLPYSGEPVNGGTSFTYHLHTLTDVSDYYLFSGDHDYLVNTWDKFVRGIQWSLSYMDSSGLMDVTSGADWLRNGMGGHNIEANAILYYTLNQGIVLGDILHNTTYKQAWTAAAFSIKSAANSLLWNSTTNLYHDNEHTLLSPQDGNSWALKANITQTAAQRQAISAALQSRWGPYGAPAPEAGLTVSPFIGSFELEAHFRVNRPNAALALLRLQWGFMLDDPRMTNSSFVEGYSMDGSLVYPPMANTARVSHAHGWSTGPTSLLSFYCAGIRMTSAAGRTWLIAPQMGDLTIVEAGYQTKLGMFESVMALDKPGGKVVSWKISVPQNTTGSVILGGVNGIWKDTEGKEVHMVDGVVDGLSGGDWALRV